MAYFTYSTHHITKSSTNGRDLSSPRLVTTPLGPNRLTLPADHRPPMLGQQLLNTTTTNPKNPMQGGQPLSSRLRYALTKTARVVVRRQTAWNSIPKLIT